MSNAIEVAVWTADGHYLSRIGLGRDLSEEQRIDDVIVDDWVYRREPQKDPCEVSDRLAPARRADVILL